MVTTLAGHYPWNIDGPGATAQFYYPAGIAVDTVGNLYVADRSNQRIRKIVLATGVVTTLAGSTLGFTDGTGTATQFNTPYGVAVDMAGNLYVADTENYCIRKIVIATGVVTTLAGGFPYGYADGTGTAAQFNYPFGVAVDTAGNLYVAEWGNHRIRKIVIATSVVTTLAGNDTWGYANGIGTVAKFEAPRSIAVDTVGNLYIADTDNNRIRKIVIATRNVTTLAGSGVPGYADGTGTAAQFNYPQDVAIDTAGNLYVADVSRIRRITPPVFTAFSTPAGTASADQSFSVSGNFLTANLTVTAPTGYEVSLSAGSGYTTSVNLTPVAASVASTLVYIRLSATTGGGTYTGNITLDSTGAPQQTLAVTGIVTGPGYSSTPASTLNVGTATVGSPVSTTLSISEIGTAQLDVTSLALSGTDAAEFSISPDIAFSIADGGAAQTVTLTCTPTTAATKTATLTVTHNAVGSPATYTLNCMGTALPTYSVTLATAGTGTGTTAGGTSYVAGATVNLTATPNAGSTFAGWSPSPCADSFTMLANDLTCTATFNVIE